VDHFIQIYSDIGLQDHTRRQRCTRFNNEPALVNQPFWFTSGCSATKRPEGELSILWRTLYRPFAPYKSYACVTEV